MKKLYLKLFPVFILLGLFLFSPRVPAYDPAAGDLSKQSETDIRLLTYNTHRMFIADPTKDGAFDRILAAIGPDVIVFEEIYYTVSAFAVQTRLESLFSSQTWHTFDGAESGWWDEEVWVRDVRNVLASRWPLWDTLTDTDPNASTRGVTIGLVDLPDDRYAKDIYVMGLHLKSGADSYNINNRQFSCDACAAWIGDGRDAKEAEHNYVSLIPYTPIIVMGDFNFFPGEQPEVTLRTGEIVNQWKFGPDVKGDWDNTDLTDAGPADPWNGSTDTWQNYSGDPEERFDRFYYTDCAATVAESFILNSESMYGGSDPHVPGLHQYDTGRWDSSDHLPVVLDLRIVPRTTASPIPTGPHSSPTPTPSPFDLLTNPGFESWTSSTCPDYWHDGSKGDATYQQETGIVHGGSSSLQLTTTTNPGSFGDGIYQQYYGIAEGSCYTFSAWLWSEQTGSMGITASWWDGSNARYWDTLKTTNAGAWNQWSIQSIAPNGTQSVRCFVRGFANTTACGYADDTSFYTGPPWKTPSPTPAPTATPLPSLLQNGNFEGWHTISEADDWKIGYSGVELRQEFENVQSRWYSAAFTTLTAAGSYGQGIYQDVPATAGKLYAFSTWTWGTTAQSMNITLSWWNGSSTISWADTVKNSHSREWEEISVSENAPSGAVSARVWIRGDLDSAFCGYVDHARFWEVPTPPPTYTPTAPPSPTPSPPPPTPTPASSLTSPDRGDYDGDGTSDIAVFRPSSGLWAVRATTRIYYGSVGDIPIPGDYDGDGTSEAAVYKSASGLWALRGVTRIYFGGSADRPLPGDYDGDGTCDQAIFRSATSLWALRGISRIYFGGSNDRPVPGDYNGDGSKSPAVFRESSGLWAIRDFSRCYFGRSGDSPVPGDFSGDGSWESAVFRPANGLWSIRTFTRIYFGGSEDQPVPADFSGNLTSSVAVFRSASGLWAVKGLTRAYYGSSGDLPVTR